MVDMMQRAQTFQGMSEGRIYRLLILIHPRMDEVPKVLINLLFHIITASSELNNHDSLV